MARSFRGKWGMTATGVSFLGEKSVLKLIEMMVAKPVNTKQKNPKTNTDLYTLNGLCGVCGGWEAAGPPKSPMKRSDSPP